MNPGQVVTREDLRRTVWTDETSLTSRPPSRRHQQGAYRTGDSATASVHRDPSEARLPFSADVHDVEVIADPAVLAQPVAAPPPQNSVLLSGRRRWIAAVSLAFVALALYGSAKVDFSSAPPRSIAVLPSALWSLKPVTGHWKSASPSRHRQARAAEAVAGAVDPRGAALREGNADPRWAGRELVSMRSRWQPDASGRQCAPVRSAARRQDRATLWAEQWDLPWTDILLCRTPWRRSHARAGTQARARGTNVAAEARRTSPRTRISAGPLPSLRRTVDDSRRARALEESVRLDPGSARAHASLSFAYISIPLLQGPTGPSSRLGRRSRAPCADLDPTVAEAHSVLARILMHFDWDAEGSDRVSRRALELDPTDPFSLHCYSLMLADQGRFDEALVLADRALALDPSPCSRIATKPSFSISHAGSRRALRKAA